MKVLVVDGHPAMRLGLKGLLDVTSDLRVIGEADHGEVALCLAEKTKPDLLIVGLNLIGKMSGVEVCQEIKSLPEPPRIMVCTAYDFSEQIASCLLNKADSCVHKSIYCEELLDAIRSTVAGKRVWLPHAAATETSRPSWGDDILTTKEREILVLLLCGCSNPEIAEELYVTVSTVRTHVRSVLRKLGFGCRRELTRSRLLRTSNF